MKDFTSPPVQIDLGHDETNWPELQTQCQCLSDWGLAILKRGLKSFAGTAILEPRYTCKDHRNLFSNFYSKKLNSGSSECARVHFFSANGITADKFLADPTGFADDYIGYSVIRPVAQRSLGRTIINPEKIGKRLKDGYYCLRTPFTAHVAGKTLTVSGYPYTSQDTDATVCAHATLWGACRYFSERYPSYGELLPYDLVKLTANTMGRVVPYRGMIYSDYSKILSDFGCHPLIFRMKASTTTPDIEPEKLDDVYSYVESGIPVLASFGGHVAALIGHTMDFGRSFTPDSENLVSSSSFLKQFIVIDDNFFPYQLLGYPGDSANYSTTYSIHSIATAVCPLPEKVYLPASVARRQARTLLKNLITDYGKAAFGTGSATEPLVTRLFFTSGASWKRRKLISAAADPSKIDQLSAFIVNIHLPHFVWIMEVGPKPLYDKGECSAEIVLDATANKLEPFPIYARVGSTLLVDGKTKTIGGNPTTFRQYTHNLGERDA